MHPRFTTAHEISSHRKSEAGFCPKDLDQFTKLAGADLKYKMQLQKKGKIVGGGPYLDTLGVCYILETKTIEEMGDILFDSPANFFVDREVHPIGTFEDSLEGMSSGRK